MYAMWDVFLRAGTTMCTKNLCHEDVLIARQVISAYALPQPKEEEKEHVQATFRQEVKLTPGPQVNTLNLEPSKGSSRPRAG